MGARRPPDGGLDFDALAPYWHHFEDRGLSLSGLSWIESAVAPPCLFVGSGRGVLAARLVDRLGARAVTIADASLAMLRRSVTPPEVARACCDVRALPFADATYATVVCATGVIEAMSADDRAAAFRELARIGRPGAAALVAVLVGAHGERPDAWALLDVWRATPVPDPVRWRAFEGVARDLGDREAAYQLLRRSLPRCDATADPDAIAAAAAAAGLRVAGRFDVAPEVAVFRIVA